MTRAVVNPHACPCIDCDVIGCTIIDYTITDYTITDYDILCSRRTVSILLRPVSHWC
jgi:hypothetical protein